MQKLSLNGEWKICLQDVGKGTYEKADAILKAAEGYVGGLVTVEGKGLTGKEVFPGKVPGDVHIALTEAGVVADPLVGENSKECRWLEEKEFWYRKTFAIPDGFLQDETELVFEGLDLTADIWLNGQYIGGHNNAFIEKVINVSDCIQTGENEVIVRIDDGVYGVKDKDIEFNKHSWNAEQPYRSWMRKPQFVYGWDWTIWLPTCGIWKDVTLRSFEKAAVRDVHIVDTYEGESISKADKVILEVTAEVETFKAGNYQLKWEVCPDERFGQNCAGAKVGQWGMKERAGEFCAQEAIYAGEVDLIAPALGTCNVTFAVPIEHPKLWWPNGAGNPYLYSVRLTLIDKAGDETGDEAGKEIQCVCRKHGIRSVRISEPVLDEKSKSFTYVINDTPIFAKGANHVPADCLIGRITDEKNRKLLSAAADANMNMIRVWGGGIYESDGFMETCDELGLMVWHDFMFACEYYPDHVPEFYEEIRREATAAIKRLRSHASLVGWSGNNEIQEMYTSAKQSGKDFPWYGGRLYEELLPGLVKELCPDRIYRESSPFGGVEPTSYDEGDQHTWHFTHRPAWEHYLDLWRFTDFDFKFLSEFGIIGAMNLESARKCISAEALTPQSSEWLHHTNTSVEHQLVDIFVKKYFDVDENISVQDYILKSQVLQGELMRHVYDELRSRKFRCSGILLWTLSDSYGIHNWSVIDYYLSKRPVYYYLKRSMAPINVSFMGYEVQTFDGMAGYKAYYAGDVKPIELLLTSDLLTDKDVTVEWRVLSFDGRELMSGQQDCKAPANSAGKFLEVDITQIKDTFVPEEALLYARVLEDNERVSGEAESMGSAGGGCQKVLNENKYFFAPYGKLHLKKAEVKWELSEIAGNEDGEEKISGETAPRGGKAMRLTLTADTFVWMLHLSDMDGIEYSDNDFDLLPGEPRSLVLTGQNLDGFVPPMCCLNGLK